MKLTERSLPKVLKGMADARPIENFPLTHYSYSTFVKFSTNPIMFKINYLNGDRIDTTTNISAVCGKAFHSAMECYHGFADDKAFALQKGLEQGIYFLNEYPEGFIEYSTTIPTKQKAIEVFTFAYNSYVKERKPSDEVIGCEMVLEHDVNVEYRGMTVHMPVKLKGVLDRVDRAKRGLKVYDYKLVNSFSDEDKIDGTKIIQAITYYFLAYAEFKEAPYSCTFQEVKRSQNRDGSPQVKEYEIVYEEYGLFFDFYFRFYEDITRALNGEMVYVPNVSTIFDNEVSVIAYINRLDVPEEAARQMQELRVTSITELLKSKIQNAGNMRKLLQAAEKNFVSSASLNYDQMTIEDRIKTKLMEHGMLIEFHSKVEGHSFDLFRYNPSIGLKMSKIKAYAADIEQVVGSTGVRILAPIPNSTLIGFEIPRANRTFPTEIPKPQGYELAMGVDIMGQDYRFDITKAPHMLVAGATGSGKSVFLNSVISQLQQVDNVEIHLYDPKMVELSRFRKGKNVTDYHDDIQDIHLALEYLVKEMNERYDKLAKAGARSVAELPEMKRIFVVIDEFGDLTISNVVLEEHIGTGEVYSKGPKMGEEKMTVRKTNFSQEISKNILLLAQKARAAGIHLIIATQRPSTDIITGSIKANFPTKVAFRTAKEVDSRVLLDQAGAEKLLGRGDMLFNSDEGEVRLQGFNC
jgi:energy-coupling factor transporter ATP-binding protein EcfA2